MLKYKYDHNFNSLRVEVWQFVPDLTDTKLKIENCLVMLQVVLELRTKLF